MSLPVWISEGDPAGISQEILEKSLPDLVELSNKRPVILVKHSMTELKNDFLPLNLKSSIPNSGLYFTSIERKNSISRVSIGNPCPESGEISFQSLKSACELIKTYGGDLITLPLSKEWVIRSGRSKFVGHTEYLAEKFSCNTYMIMFSKTWKVLVLTTHIPLKKVVSNLKKYNWKKLFKTLGEHSLFHDARIGMCGVNPHAGEGGKIGTEDLKILSPIVKKYSKWHKLSGPYPADSMFTEEWKEKFDLILACYHDQGLAPFKGLVGKKGINLTIGLPFQRVSPDHGPAYEIAGKGIASPESLVECIRFFSNPLF